MNGALRVMWLLFSALSVQRVLFGIGALFILAAFFLPPDLRALLIFLGLLLPLVPTLLAGGALLRYFIAPRHMRLVPRAREQVLAGLLSSILAVATVVTLAAWGVGLPPDQMLILWLRIVAGLSVLLLSQFVVITNVAAASVWFLMLVALLQPQLINHMRGFWLGIGQDPVLLAAIFVVTWIGFAFWFLRTLYLGAPRDSFPVGKGVTKITQSPATAVRTLLLGSPTIVGLFRSGFFVVAMLTAAMMLVGLTTQSAPSLAGAVAKAVNPSLILAVYAGIGGFLVVRRSKSLWLGGGRDRMGVFKTCEAHAWMCYVATLAPLLLFLAVACFLSPSSQWSYVATISIHMVSGAWFLYLGLMHVRGWRAADFVTAIVLFGAWLVTFANVQFVVDRPWTYPLVVGAMACVALALRFVAMRRWRRIDWLVCKPPRQMPRGFQSVN